MKKQLISSILFIAYFAFLMKIMVWKDLPMVRIGFLQLNFGGTQVGSGNWIPFKTIIPYLLGEKGLLIGGINILGNILLLVPIGFIFPFIKVKMAWKECLLYALLICFSIEGLQVFLRVGIFDIDDVILNVLGVIIGFACYPVYQSRKKTFNFLIAGLLALLFIYLGFYYQENGQLPVALEKEPKHVPNALPQMAIGAQNTSDPCNGTGGTGQIISKGLHFFMLKSKEGRTQKVLLTPSTSIKTSAGSANESDLQVGNRVTIVIDESETAQLVLVCQ
jgi:glycopeptide antibiotics resistance protein